MCDRVFLNSHCSPREQTHAPNSVGVYTAYKDSVTQGGMTMLYIATFDHGTHKDSSPLPIVFANCDALWRDAQEAHDVGFSRNLPLSRKLLWVGKK